MDFDGDFGLWQRKIAEGRKAYRGVLLCFRRFGFVSVPALTTAVAV